MVTLQHQFFGRDSELAKLNTLLDRYTTSLVIVKGRRRIGKSRLIGEFGSQHTYYELTGLWPTKKTTAQSQRDEFSRQLAEQTGLPNVTANDWGDLFHLLSDKIKDGRTILLLDEISWMGSKDTDFSGKLKIAWDLYFQKNPQLILVLCSSVSTWIDENIIGSSNFMGRPTMYIDLDELPLEICAQFWRNHSLNVSSYEKLKLLAVTGGVPRYLELINPKQTAEENIQNLLFSEDGVLVHEFKFIFSDIFGKRSKIYKDIMSTLAGGSADQKTIADRSGRTLAGDISNYLNDLMEAGFVARDYTWSIKSGEISKLSHYRLKDNYLRFYLKYVEPNLAKIEKSLFANQSLTALPNWDGIMGLQFENLVLNNAHLVKQALGLPNNVIIFDNPFFQRKTNRQPGCQIDYLIQTKHNTIYICEIKFSRHPIGSSIIDEVKQKIERIHFPKNFSYRAVLIHVNGVTQEVISGDYFAKIVDFSDFLQ